MYQVIIVVHIFLGLGVIGLILMQQGKGADAGAAFGSGGSGSVFGAQGSASFLSRTTAVLAAAFFSTSLGLAVLSSTQTEPVDLMDAPALEQPLAADVPVVDNVNKVVPDSVPAISDTAPVDVVPSVEKVVVIPDAPVIAHEPVVPETPVVIEPTAVIEENSVTPVIEDVVPAITEIVTAVEKVVEPIVDVVSEQPQVIETAPATEIVPDKEVVVGQ